MEVIKLNSSGESVKKLQTLLNIKVTGVFDTNTDTAVKKFQKTNGLLDDGIVGNNTWKVLLKDDNIVNRLRGHIQDSVLNELIKISDKYEINTEFRIAHFLGQCAHESGNFKVVSENLNYSKDGLIKIFGKYFPGNLSESYARKPELIGSRVYANRMGNGDEKSKDGFKYSGKGFIQLTGKSNFKEFSDFIKEDCVKNPDIVATKYPLTSALFFFSKNNLWSICDKGISDDTILSLTKRINGGTHGLEDRKAKTLHYYNILTN